MIAQKTRRTFLVDLAGCHGEDELDNIGLTCFDEVTVDEQEGKGGQIGGSLVAVGERMVAGDTVKIRRP